MTSTATETPHSVAAWILQAWALASGVTSRIKGGILANLDVFPTHDTTDTCETYALFPPNLPDSGVLTTPRDTDARVHHLDRNRREIRSLETPQSSIVKRPPALIMEHYPDRREIASRQDPKPQHCRRVID